jgi:Raf kinase inhibitor-like YbhB/YbcL family protein
MADRRIQMKNKNKTQSNLKSIFFVLAVSALMIGLNELISFSEDMRMKIVSPEFDSSQLIPEKYTCQGKDINPKLILSDIPKEAKSLALIVDDPDAPNGTWTHWVVFDIPADSTEIKEDTIPGIQGANNFGKNDWGGPCPPSGTHRYYFKAFALDKKLELKEGAKRGEVEKAMKGHVLDEAELMGKYQQQK